MGWRLACVNDGRTDRMDLPPAAAARNLFSWGASKLSRRGLSSSHSHARHRLIISKSFHCCRHWLQHFTTHTHNRTININHALQEISTRRRCVARSSCARAVAMLCGTLVGQLAISGLKLEAAELVGTITRQFLAYRPCRGPLASQY